MAPAERMVAATGADRQVTGMKGENLLWSRKAVGKIDAPLKETVFHSKAFTIKLRAAKVPKNALWFLKHSKASYIFA